jgi:hypothetical protein
MNHDGFHHLVGWLQNKDKLSSSERKLLANTDDTEKYF